MNEIPLSLGPCPECKEKDYHADSCSMYEKQAQEAMLYELPTGPNVIRHIEIFLNFEHGFGQAVLSINLYDDPKKLPDILVQNRTKENFHSKINLTGWVNSGDEINVVQESKEIDNG